MKTLLRTSMDVPAEAGHRAELEAFALHAMTKDMRAGLAAFRAKQTPIFSGD